MGLIKEPKGVDLVVGPSVLTEQDRKLISEIIANYKLTGKLPSKNKKNNSRSRNASQIEKKKKVTA
jgi:hypothetical protein